MRSNSFHIYDTGQQSIAASLDPMMRNLEEPPQQQNPATDSAQAAEPLGAAGALAAPAEAAYHYVMPFRGTNLGEIAAYKPLFEPRNHELEPDSVV
jgi:hypothetical protein